MSVRLKTEKEVDAMRKAGKILASVFDLIADHVKPGVSAKELDDLIHKTIVEANAKPSFYGYRGFKYASCISKNEEVVHGIPHADKIMLEGDICSIDIGVHYSGYHADAARTFAVGHINNEAKRLIDVTRESFFEAIKEALPGKYLGDIAAAMQYHVEKAGFGVVRDLCSHGIGRDLHEEPLIPNFGKRGQGMRLKAGMTFPIEPMVTQGTFEVLTLPDKWTIITADKKWAAHYENTIHIGKTGAEILTLLA